MTDERAAAALIGGITLLERAINYTLGSLHLVTPEALSRPTPCRDWDLCALLGHLDESFSALHEALADGRLGVDEPTRSAVVDQPGDPAFGLRSRACDLLGAYTSARGRRLVSIAGSPLTTAVVMSTGAIEVAIHGWDIASACGQHRPIPPSLAEEMLDLSPLFVTDADRPGRFAAPVELPPLAGPADRLVAFLGRHPQQDAWVGQN
jgi:uncharacterized protein (TIGR03086 family)